MYLGLDTIGKSFLQQDKFSLSRRGRDSGRQAYFFFFLRCVLPEVRELVRSYKQLSIHDTLIIHGPGLAIGFHERAQPLQLRIV